MQALQLLNDEPEAMLVAGSTDWGVEVNLRGSRAALAVAIEELPELRTFTIGDDVIEIGAALSLSEVERRLAGRVPLLAQLFPQFASRLIRNRATLGGNLGTGSPIGDAPPALLALGARVVLASVDGEREVELSEYFTGYRETVRQANELIRAIRIPLPLAGVTAFHKISKRRFDDISSVAIAFALDIEDGSVTAARIGLGGVAATPLRAYATEAALVGRALECRDRARGVSRVARRGIADLRPSRECRLPLDHDEPGAAQALRRDRSRAEGGVSMSTLAERPDNAVVGTPSPHESAELHVTGSAMYTDDIAAHTAGRAHRLARPIDERARDASRST